MKFTLLLTALAFTGVASIATAGPDLQELALRKQIADSQRAARTVVADSSPVTYVANPTGKGSTVVPKSDAGVTNIALFKSKKAAHCDYCAKH